jgi:hypothetical protein
MPPDASDPAGSKTTGSPRPAIWRLLLAIALPVLTLLVVMVLAKRVESNPADPNAALAVPVVFQPGATSAGCAALDAALPATVDGHARRALVAAEPGVAAWGEPPVVLRCGIGDPEELTCSSALTVINGVSWLELSDSGTTTYIAVDRSVRLAVSLDDSVGIGAIQALANTIGDVLPEREVCVSGSVNPVDY